VRIVYSAASKGDLLEIGEWIARDSNLRSQTFVEELREACENLVHMPRAFPLIRAEQGIRRKVYKNYLIFYVAAEDRIEILRVIHGARDYEKLLFPK
jgi:plasmid stabilization system protein ParE